MQGIVLCFTGSSCHSICHVGCLTVVWVVRGGHRTSVSRIPQDTPTGNGSSNIHRGKEQQQRKRP